MKKQILFFVLQPLFFSIYNASANPRPGVGYSKDMQQILPKICFKITNLTHDKWSSEIGLSTSMGFSELEQKLKVKVSAKGSFEMLSSSAESDFLRSIQEKSYSLSFNFVQKLREFVTWDIDGMEINSLTESGREIYEKYHELFGIKCGDYFLSSFERGAILVVSLNLEFSSNERKEDFKANMKGNYGDLFSASGDIENVAKKMNLKGKVSLQALQIGGNPSELGKIFGKDKTGKHYIVNCDLQNMKNCQDASGGILDYSRDNFSQQIKFDYQNNRLLGNYVSLPYGQENYTSIQNLLLNPSLTLIDNETIQIRSLLSKSMIENYWYKDKIFLLLNSYPIKWDTSGTTYKNIKKLDEKIQRNIDILINGDPKTGTQGSIQCFNSPSLCKSIGKDLLNKIEITKLTNKDINLLSPIRYYYPRKLFIVCHNGKEFVIFNKTEYQIVPIKINLTPTNYYFKYNFHLEYVDTATSNDGGLTYNGFIDCMYIKTPFVLEAKQIDLYFDLYSDEEEDYDIII